jgi:polar amino acid transport system permease protein
MEGFSWQALVTWGPLLLAGLPNTILIAFLSIWLGVVIGFLGGLGRVSANPVIATVARVYVDVIRGVPLLVLLYLMYFGIGVYVNVPRYVAAVTALGIFSGAFVAEIVRAAIQSIPIGQTEAALALGVSERQAMRKIILPQAFKRMVPPLAGQFISLTKDSSLASIIAIPELTLMTYQVVTVTFRSFQFWITTALLYFVLGLVLSHIAERLERRFHVVD